MGPRAILIVLAATACLLPFGARAGGVASLNLCSDLLVLMLADREDIAAVTWLAADPADSPLAAQAQGLPVNYGSAEEILLLDPDVTIAARYARGETVAMLRRLGRRVVMLDPADSLDGIHRNLRIVGEAVGHPERAEAAIAAMDRQLDALAAEAHERPPMLAAVYMARGFTVGAHSVIHDLLGVLNLRNLGADPALAGQPVLPVETLLIADPDILVVTSYGADAPSLATAVVDHPALSKLRAERPVITVPTMLWDCGTPLVVEAAKRIAAGLDASAVGSVE